MRIDLITLFPEYFAPLVRVGPVRAALEAGSLELYVHNLAHFADHPKQVDDVPYGGGAGMVLRPEPVVRALRSLPRGFVVYLSAQGVPLCQRRVEALAHKPHLILIAGRYKGLDERVIRRYVHLEISIGDYVLSGGEPAALVLVDAVARLLPGALGDQASSHTDSFQWGILGPPEYTRPPVFEGMEVPEVLRSGDHQAVARWRRKEALRKTLLRRPDLLRNFPLTPEDQRLLREILQEEGFMQGGDEADPGVDAPSD